MSVVATSAFDVRRTPAHGPDSTAITLRLPSGPTSALARVVAGLDVSREAAIIAAAAALVMRYRQLDDLRIATTRAMSEAVVAPDLPFITAAQRVQLALRQVETGSGAPSAPPGSMAPSPSPGAWLWFRGERSSEEATATADAAVLHSAGGRSGNPPDAALSIAIHPDHMDVIMAAPCAALRAGSTDHLQRQLAMLLEDTAAHRWRCLGDLALLDDGEARRLVLDFNARSLALPTKPTATALFETVVARCPDRTAIVTDGLAISFAELDQRAHALVHRLARAGVQPGHVVGVFVDRSIDAVVAILGILKCGAAWLPLDPDLPAARLSFMVEDAGVPFILARPSQRDAVPLPRERVISLEPADGLAESTAPLPAGHAPGADSLAYVIYTSGSTGTPKGALLGHRGLVNMALAHGAELRLHDRSRILQFFSLVFDASVFELFVPLLNGATIVMPRRDVLMDPKALADVLRRERVTSIQLPPGVLATLPTDDLPDLETVLVGGEIYPDQVVARWAAHCRVLNFYGPTEATVSATCFERTADTLASVIGRPLANVRVYVLDEARRPVPVGVPGELHIAGHGVGKGYLNRPDLTAAKFLRDPFSLDPAALMYRTGDRGKHRPDGTLEFIGRSDTQVKLRGFRIELEEVEAALKRCAAVRDATVALRLRDDGLEELVGCVVASGTDLLDVAALRAQLADSCPGYMIPSRFVQVSEVPRTPNGKIDRSVLLAGTELAVVASGPGGLHTETERQIAAIWRELLRADAVAPDSRFLDLGGHSLLALRVAARARERLGVTVPISDILGSASLRSLARTIDELRTGTAGVHWDGASVPPDAAALSPGQEALWLLQQSAPDSVAYNVSFGFRLNGHVDVVALERALSTCVERHAPLRTRIVEHKGTPLAVLAGVGELRLETIIAEGGSQAAAAMELARAVEQLSRRPFDLGRELPIRTRLLHVSPSEHVLIVVLHHIAADGWSFGVLVKELSAAYAAWCAGTASALPRPTASYADFVRIAAAAQGHAQRDGALEHWRRRLAAAPDVTRLPLDRPRPADRTGRGGQVKLRIEPELLASLRAIAQGTSASLFSVLAAALAVLLVRHGAEDELVLGTVVANREHPDLEELIGYFVNAVPLRIDLSGDPSLREAVERARDAALEALDHRLLPFDVLVRDRNRPRVQGASPVFQVMLVLQDLEIPPLTLGAIEAEPIEFHNGTCRFDLLWDLGGVFEGALVGSVEYAEDIFDRATVERLVARLDCVLRAMVNDLATQVSKAELVTAADREALLASSRPSQMFRTDRGVHELFEEQAQQTPSALALSFLGRSVTYAELDDQASRVASALLERGLPPTARVVLCLERGPGLVAAIIGVLKAAGIYVPIDPQDPHDRCELIIKDCAAEFVITDPQHASRFEQPGRDVLVIGRDTEAPSTLEIRPYVAPQSVAYIIYTSGTSGQPKGVQITHHNVARLLACARALFELGATDVWTLFHSYAFDWSVWELWGALTFGARLVVVPHSVSRDPDAFLQLLNDERVTVLCQTPSAFTQLMRAELRAEQTCGQSLRYVIFGGEALNYRSLTGWFARHAETAPRLVNMYGITETTVHVTYRDVRAADCQSPASLIGRPLPDLAVYVVDRHGQLVPNGIAGELWIGGGGVGIGYLNRPELDAARFVQNPFVPRSGRVYRSGDLGRRRLDGDLEYLGRLDHQVKIRGFRVELGEIESCLLRHPGVTDAVADVRSDDTGQSELVAWILAPRGTALVARQLLKNTLPEHMVPSRLIELDAFPLTAMGKIDRRALPMAQTAARKPDRDRTAPRTSIERDVAGIWQDVLGIDGVGVEESFFDIGGHSLLAAKMVLRVRGLLGVSLPVRAAFEAPTIERLAAVVEGLRRGDGAATSGEVDTERLVGDARLDAAIRPAAERRAAGRVLVTGATGFLGVHLLDALLHSCDAEIECLIRCDSPDDGRARLRASMRAYGLPDPSHRVHVMPADLVRPALGLSAPEFDALADRTAAIYHAAAWVSFLQSYDQLRITNVEGTRALLRLACLRGIPFNHISTTGVFGTPSYRHKIDTITEDADLAIGLGVGHIGYVQSKWVAEQLAWEAQRRGLPVRVFRCGLLMGHSRTGHTNLRDFPSMLIKGCIELGAAYKLRKLDNFIPVDAAAQAIVHIAQRSDSLGRAFHVVNPHNIELLDLWALIQQCGYDLDVIPYEAWIDRLFAARGGPEANALYPVISLFLEKVPAAGRSVIELFEGQPVFDCASFVASLSDSSIRCQRVDRELVRTWLAYYQTSGFIPAPRFQSRSAQATEVQT